jgi:DNA-binding SARP family transcriptional activator
MRVVILGQIGIPGHADLRRRDRMVLGVLVVRGRLGANVDDLTDALWGPEPPPSSRKILQSCVVRLRRALGPEGIAALDDGYRLALPAVGLDAADFERAVAAAQAEFETGDPDSAADTIRGGLALWHGDPLGELADWGPAAGEAARLLEARESAEELLARSSLAAGRISQAVVAAERLTASAPLRESGWALLARARYASGQQADALDALRRMRVLLRDELGLDPGPEATALEQAILRQDPSLDIAPTTRWDPPPRRRRILLPILAGSLALAVSVGVVVAVISGQEAARAQQLAAQARAASESLRVGRLAESEHDPAVALGLAAESLTLDDSSASRTSALETFGRFAALLSSDEGPEVSPVEPFATTTDRHEEVTSPDGRLIARAIFGGIEIRSTADGNLVRQLSGIPITPNALAFDASGTLLAAGLSEPGFDDAATTIVWNVGTGVEIARYDSGDGQIWVHEFAPDGSSITVIGEDGTHRWDLTGSHALIRTATLDPSAFRAGDVMLSLGDDSVEEWVTLACELAGRQLTESEWAEAFPVDPYRPVCRRG